MTGAVSLTLMAVLIFVHVGYSRHENIKSLDLEDISLVLNTGPGVSVPCGEQVDMRNSTSRHFQTPNYPQNYPRGKAGRCSWTFLQIPKFSVRNSMSKEVTDSALRSRTMALSRGKNVTLEGRRKVSNSHFKMCHHLHSPMNLQ